MVALYAMAILAPLLGGGGGSSDVVLLDFYSTQCGPCRKMEPTIATLESHGAPIRKVDVNREPHIAKQYNVTMLPTFVLTVDGQEIDRIVGPCRIGDLAALFRKAQQPGIAAKAGTGPAMPQPSLVASPVATTPSRDPFLQHGPPAELPPSPPAANLPYQPAPAPAYSPPPAYAQPPVPAGQPFAMANATPAPFANPAPAATTSPPAQPVVPAHLRGGAMEGPAPRASQGREVPAMYVAPVPIPRGPSAMEQAMAASVRLKVEDASGFSYGTGTVVHSHGNESLVITCGHIFRDSKGQGPIHVDLFAAGTRSTVRGSLLHCDLDRDVALVTIRTEKPLPVARVAPANRNPNAGERVFSIGCNHGQDPTLMNGQVNQTNSSRVTTSQGENVYLVEVSGKPVDGRSGGGLFTANGELIGICNFADRQAERGFYASAATVRGALDAKNLSFVYRQPPPTNDNAQHLFADQAQPLPPDPAPANPGNGAPNVAPFGGAPVGVLSGPIAGVPPGAQVICLVRGPADPNGRYSMYVLEQPSHSFLEQLAKESRTQTGEPTTLRIER